MRIFNTTDALGKIVRVDTVDFRVTAIIKDIPLNSHLRFDMLGSYISIDNHMSAVQRMVKMGQHVGSLCLHPDVSEQKRSGYSK